MTADWTQTKANFENFEEVTVSLLLGAYLHWKWFQNAADACQSMASALGTELRFLAQADLRSLGTTPAVSPLGIRSWNCSLNFTWRSSTQVNRYACMYVYIGGSMVAKGRGILVIGRHFASEGVPFGPVGDAIWAGGTKSYGMTYQRGAKFNRRGADTCSIGWGEEATH